MPYGYLVSGQRHLQRRAVSLVLATDPGTFIRLVGQSDADFEWVSPVDTAGETVSRARAVSDRQVAAYHAAGLPVPLDFGRTNGGTGQLPTLADRAELIRAGLRGPVLPIALGGTLLALLLVGAAGSYWADRRARRGAAAVRPRRRPGRAGRQGGAGAGPAGRGRHRARRAAGPLAGRPARAEPEPGPGRVPARRRCVVAAGLLAGLALLGLVAGLRAATPPSGRSAPAGPGWPGCPGRCCCSPAPPDYLALRGTDAVTGRQNVAQVNLLVVVFPLLFILGGSVLAVRLLTLLLPLLAARPAGCPRPGTWPPAGSPRPGSPAVVLLAAAAAPVAIAVYAAGLTGGPAHAGREGQGLHRRGDLGRDDRPADPQREDRPPARSCAGTATAWSATPRSRSSRSIRPRCRAPRTGGDEFAGRSLPDLLTALAGPATGGRLPAIVVDPRPELGPTADVTLGTSTARVATATTASLFPGRRLPQPMIIVDRNRLGPIDPHAGSFDELWTNGPAAPAEAAVPAQDQLIFDTIDQAQVFDAADYLGITWTFGYLTALAGLVGLVSVGALLLYVETRQRTRVAAYALGRRMGLSRATHLRSLLAELGLLLGLAYVVGVALSWVALGLVHGLLDVDPARPPASLLVLPVGVLVGAAVAVAAVAALTALHAQRVADRTAAATVLRLT